MDGLVWPDGGECWDGQHRHGIGPTSLILTLVPVPLGFLIAAQLGLGVVGRVYRVATTAVGRFLNSPGLVAKRDR